MKTPNGFRNVSDTTTERYQREDGDATIERSSYRRWIVKRRGASDLIVCSRGSAIKRATDHLAVIDPRIYLSTSAGMWRLIDGGVPLCADSADRSKAESIARLLGLNPATLAVWNGDAGAWERAS